MSKCYRFPSLLVGAFALCAALGLAQSAEAGVELRSKTTLYGENPPRVESTTTLAHDGSLRIDIEPTGDAKAPAAKPSQEAGGAEPTTSNTRQRKHSTIFRGAFEDFLIVDHGHEAFTLIDDEAIEDLEARLQFTMLQLDRKMAELPVEQRRRMRDALAGPPPKPEATVVKTERKEKRNGLECQFYEVRRGDELVRRVCVAAWDQVEGGDELRGALEKLKSFTGRLDEAFQSVRSEALGGAQIFEIGENPFQDFERLGGLPVHTVEYEDGKPSFETVIEKIEPRELSQRDFLPPPSYKRRSWTGE